jgi:hypothetical protein
MDYMLTFLYGALLYVIVSCMATFGFLGLVRGKIKISGGPATQPINPFTKKQPANLFRKGWRARLLGGGLFFVSIITLLVSYFAVTQEYLVLEFGAVGQVFILLPLGVGVFIGIWFYKEMDRTIPDYK